MGSRLAGGTLDLGGRELDSRAIAGKEVAQMKTVFDDFNKLKEDRIATEAGNRRLTERLAAIEGARQGGLGLGGVDATFLAQAGSRRAESDNERTSSRKREACRAQGARSGSLEPQPLLRRPAVADDLRTAVHIFDYARVKVPEDYLTCMSAWNSLLPVAFFASEALSVDAKREWLLGSHAHDKVEKDKTIIRFGYKVDPTLYAAERSNRRQLRNRPSRLASDFRTVDCSSVERGGHSAYLRSLTQPRPDSRLNLVHLARFFGDLSRPTA